MIICIFGDYGVGKDTFADFLVESLKEWTDSVKKIKSYTTREKRFEQEDTHEFISKEDWKNLDNFVAQTVIDGEYYGAIISQFTEKYNIYVIDEHGLYQLLEKKKNNEISDKIFVIKMERPKNLINVKESRLNRDKNTDFSIKSEDIHFEINNDGKISQLKDLAEVLPIILPYFKLIE